MTETFNINPILNSPYEEPKFHWQLAEDGRPTGITNNGRRPSIHLVPIPEARRSNKSAAQPELQLEGETKDNPIINRIRRLLKEWRQKPIEKYGVSHMTQSLLEHWRKAQTTPRPFFCQIEAVEVLIWLNEVAPKTTAGKEVLRELHDANTEAIPDLFRFASKMATGSGKTTVMAMMIAYHTLNKMRQPKSSRYSHHFLIITPGITIKDRLRVLLPSDPDNYYLKNHIVPADFLQDMKRAQVVITNYHSFKRREKTTISPSARAILQGNDKDPLSTIETEGQMLSRACKELLSAKNVVVINDEAHHCYRHKVTTEKVSITKDERDEVKKNDEAARLWISGIEALSKKLTIKAIYDLSATPFFLKGSGYPEGELFPWVVSDFALMDAIESGIVKLPRVPIDDGTVTADNLPIYRNLYKHISSELPKKGRAKQGEMNPEHIPTELRGALQTLYGHYVKTHNSWHDAGITVPPVFIIVCNNTSTSKLVYDYVSGYEIPGTGRWKKGALPLFSNVSDTGKPSNHIHTLLIDSEQLDSGEAMSKEFRELAKPEIERFQKERRQRQQGRDDGKVTDEELLREVMNTIGRKGHLGEQVRCVVSVSMLTEGWDTNNVTHILGIRAFGTQLLCEQVVGRGLRRYNYDVDEDGKFSAEYADVFGVPFTFATGAKIGITKPPKPQTRVTAEDTRAHAAISFPRVRGYTIRIPDERLEAKFTEDSRLVITPENAPPRTLQQSIVGEDILMTLDDMKKHRDQRVIFFLAAETAKKFVDEKGQIPPARFRDLIPITRQWYQNYLNTIGGTHKQYMLWKVFAIIAAERIYNACISSKADEGIIIPLIDNFTPKGSTHFVDFPTTKGRLFETSCQKSHVNIAACDSDWEMSFCQYLEDEPAVHAYARNEGLGFVIPYNYLKTPHSYYPDFIVRIDDGNGADDLLNLVLEVKGQKDDKARVKADTARVKWVPSINNDGRFGRWAYIEITDGSPNVRRILRDIANGRITELT